MIPTIMKLAIRIRNVLVVPALLISLSLVSLGCGKGSKSTQPDNASNRETPDPWPQAAMQFRKETDPVTARRVLSDLNSGLPAVATATQLQSLPSEQANALKAELRLNDAEVKDLLSAQFTPLDAQYLAECFFFRDAARSLEIQHMPPARRAQVAFDWVCRQILIQPAFAPLPPILALRRGAGSGLDRATVFLALCQQLELDAFMVGQAEASDWLSTHIPAGTKDPKGPFFAVGIRDGNSILLYEPWRGEPIPGPTPGRPASLAEVRQNPDLVNVWLNNTAFPWDVTRNALKNATLFIAPRPTSLTARMKIFEEKLFPELRVHVAMDLARIKADAAKATQDPGLVRLWCPPNDPYCVSRVQAAFLSPNEGGYGITTQTGVSLADVYQNDLIPRDTLLQIPEGLTNPLARSTLGAYAAANFSEAFARSPTPRERIQRGQFTEVSQTLVSIRDEFSVRRERARSLQGREAIVAQFITNTNKFFNEDLAQGRRTRNEIDLAIVQYYQSQQQGVSLALDGTLGETMVAESTYLLALATQERAERAQIQYERVLANYESASPAQRKNLERSRAEALEQVRDAWSVCRDWWLQYEPFAQKQNDTFPGRLGHSRAMLARVNGYLQMYR